MNSTGEWCPFEHINVGHELTKNTSRVHACFPAAPPEMEIEIPCPNNSTAYYWDRKIKHLTRKCQKNGTWATHEGHCGCHYDIFKWDRVAFYFSGFQKFKVLLGMVTLNKKQFWHYRWVIIDSSMMTSKLNRPRKVIFSASSLVVATIILTRLNSLHCTRNTIHLHLVSILSNPSQIRPNSDLNKSLTRTWPDQSLSCISVCGMSFIQHNRFLAPLCLN